MARLMIPNRGQKWFEIQPQLALLMQPPKVTARLDRICGHGPRIGVIDHIQVLMRQA